MHKVLYALYEGPPVPVPPTGVREEKEFHATLRRMRTEKPEPWYHRYSLRAGVVAMAGAAAALTLALFDVTPGSLGELEPLAQISLGDHQPEAVGSPSMDGAIAAAEDGGIDHPAQSYGRVVGGVGAMITPDDRPVPTSTFPVGTQFRVGLDDNMQVGLVGKIVANFTPGTELEWTTASQDLIELRLDRGIAAMRYERRPSDPVLHVRTPTALVKVVGTVFTVQVDGDDQTVVSVLRGQVEVLNPKTNALMAEVESGYRYDVATSGFGDVGTTEVRAALPLSNEAGRDVAEGQIPDSWNVPGLPAGDNRTLAYVPGPAADPEYVMDLDVTKRRSKRRRGSAVGETTRVVEDDGEPLIQALMRDAEATRKKELLETLQRCEDLYSARGTRYLSARCLSRFLAQYGEDPLAVRGHLLVGILRMDYALDYRAAESAFREFLRRAPRHRDAELARYRMWLAATEDGRISVALERGRTYLTRYPNGRFVGKVLQRFPELKGAL